MAVTTNPWINRKTPCGGFVQIEKKHNEDGSTVKIASDLTSKKLPSADDFKLEKLLKAGVSLEQVNSKFLSPDIRQGLENIEAFENSEQGEE